MEKSIKIEQLSFCYPESRQPALDEISLCVNQGEFITIFGASGCGKTTLLKQLKPELMPSGSREGKIWFEGEEITRSDSPAKIGFVQQNPDNQIVCDKVWHELAFGLESLGMNQSEMRARVAETASFFGIQNWFHKRVADLSGGQKQLLNLASVMVMQPSLLILDEPTSQLDPIGAEQFLNTVKKINQELGTTVLFTEHRLEDAIPLSDKVLVMEKGRVLVYDTPRAAGAFLKEKKHPLFYALPTPMKIYAAVDSSLACPLTVKEGRDWVLEMAETTELRKAEPVFRVQSAGSSEIAVQAKKVWFRYEKDGTDILKGASLTVKKGEIFALVGGNGTGKSTFLNVLAGVLNPYRGNVLRSGTVSVLPQNPQMLFTAKTVLLDLYAAFSGTNCSESEKQKKIENAAELCNLHALLDRHPFDLSGGEQQRAALAKVLLTSPDILLLDEPTKGMDTMFKESFAQILNTLSKSGVTVIFVSHDIEFCAVAAHRCAMFFDGAVTSEGEPKSFFSGKSFYTTAANRMAREVLPAAVLSEEVISAFGGKLEEVRSKPKQQIIQRKIPIPEEKKPMPQKRKWLAFIFLAVFVLCTCLQKALQAQMIWLELVMMVCFAGFFLSVTVNRQAGKVEKNVPHSSENRRNYKQLLWVLGFVLLVIPATLLIGVYYLEDKKYYFISFMILLEIMLPFLWGFEKRKPKAREIVVIAVLSGIAIAGRAAFYMLAHFKPSVAVILLSGAAFGSETGFLVGAITAFVSNMFFGQGPWTPWQMFAMGIVGFLAGLLFYKGKLRKTKFFLSVFGFLAVFCVYGPIMNTSSVILWQPSPTFEMFLTSFALGVPFDLIHAGATVFFLWFLTEPVLEKLDRIKIKYGLMQ